MSYLKKLFGCTAVAVVIFLAAPFVYGLRPAGGVAEQRALNSAILVLEETRAVPGITPELADAIDYTTERYNTVARWNVCVAPLPASAAGINVPWTPGVSVNSDEWGRDPEMDASVLLHEAMHDYYPYFGHDHVTPIENEFWNVLL